MFSSEEILSSIHRAAPIAIGVIVDSRLKTVNAQMCKMLGYFEEELLRQNFSMLFETQEEYERAIKEKHTTMDVEGIGTVETQWQTKDGRLLDILLRSTPTDGVDIKNGLTFTATDITKQKESQRETAKIISSLGNVIADRTRWLNENNLKLHREIDKRNDIEKKLRASKKELEKTVKQLKQTQARIIQSEKMASIGQLAAGVAHEINNPTAFVSSNLNTMAQYHEDIYRLLTQYEKTLHLLTDACDLSVLPRKVAAAIAETNQVCDEIDLEFIRTDCPELIAESRDGAERIRKIVADLKDFAHPGDQRCIETDINQGLDSTINIVWNEIKYKSQLTKDYGELPSVWCYSQQINQVFMNVLINAAQAIEKDGLIQVRTRHVKDDVMIQISDNGRGIAEEIKSQIFDPFFTTKEIGAGTGLGLSMSYSIIEKHNGRIEVQSTVGEGTTFTIHLPAAANECDNELNAAISTEPA